jgi:prevent-host-death family protein
MKAFAARDLQRNAAEIERAAARGPVIITHHEAPRFVMMSLEEYNKLKGARRVVVSSENVPDSVAQRIQALADAHPNEEVVLIGGDEAADMDEEIVRAPHS